jgi:hypothetical protein
MSLRSTEKAVICSPKCKIWFDDVTRQRVEFFWIKKISNAYSALVMPLRAIDEGQD